MKTAILICLMALLTACAVVPLAPYHQGRGPGYDMRGYRERIAPPDHFQGRGFDSPGRQQRYR